MNDRRRQRQPLFETERQVAGSHRDEWADFERFNEFSDASSSLGACQSVDAGEELEVVSGALL